MFEVGEKSLAACKGLGDFWELYGIRYQVSGNLISPGEPLAIGYIVAPSKEIYKIKLKVKLINKIMQKSNENEN